MNPYNALNLLLEAYGPGRQKKRQEEEEAAALEAANAKKAQKEKKSKDKKKIPGAIPPKPPTEVSHSVKIQFLKCKSNFPYIFFLELIEDLNYERKRLAKEQREREQEAIRLI